MPFVWMRGEVGELVGKDVVPGLELYHAGGFDAGRFTEKSGSGGLIVISPFRTPAPLLPGKVKQGSRG